MFFHFPVIVEKKCLIIGMPPISLAKSRNSLKLLLGRSSYAISTKLLNKLKTLSHRVYYIKNSL